jgi:hypothetical protein
MQWAQSHDAGLVQKRSKRMAEIKLEKKEGTAIWPWILALIVLALLAWAAWTFMRGDRTAVTATPATGTTPITGTAAQPQEAGPLPQQAHAFIDDCSVAEGAQPPGMGLEHEFTINCFERLADAMQAVAAQRPADPGITQQIDTMRERARQIRESDPTSLEHSNWTRQAAEAGAAGFDAMHQTWHSGNQQVQNAVQNIRQTAEQIQPAQQMTEQQTHIRSFFRQSGEALRAMHQGEETHL